LLTRPLVPVAAEFCEIDVVLAGEFADERGKNGRRKNRRHYYWQQWVRWRREWAAGRGFLLLRGQESGQRLLRGGGSGVAFTDYAYDSVDLNGAAFGDF